jgi:hypothetical protein
MRAKQSAVLMLRRKLVALVRVARLVWETEPAAYWRSGATAIHSRHDVNPFGYTGQPQAMNRARRVSISWAVTIRQRHHLLAQHVPYLQVMMPGKAIPSC